MMGLRFLTYSLCVAAASIVIGGCRRVPDGVIPPEDMAVIMADTYMGEGVVDMNNSVFPNDSSRMVLKQSIYASHCVSREQVDTSFVWYGHHIEEYIKVLDRTEEILKERQHSLAVTSSRQLSLSGDSVNIWAGAERVTVGKGYPRRFITFAVTPDTTWHPGDSYTLRYKLVNGQRPVNSRVCVDYEGGITRIYDGRGRSQGVTSLKFRIDPDKTPERMYGYIDVDARAGEHFHIDSIALIRTRKSDFDHFYAPAGMELCWKKERDAAEADSAATDNGPRRNDSASRPPAEVPPGRDIPPANIGPHAVRR